jgi:uncharacterized protein (DUF697 family)/uncharacterized tellurite resistance protein B-like protein
MNEEVLSGIKILVALAKADGRLHDNEEIAIKNALEGADLGADVTVEKLLLEVVDVDAELKNITSDEGRRSTYEAACAMVYVDGDAADSERALLDKIRKTWAVQKPQSVVERMGSALKQDWVPSTITPIEDPVTRDETIDKLVVRACVRAAMFGAIPVPFVGEFLVSFVGIQTLQSIGALYGHSKDAVFWKAFAGNFVGATAARIAILSLMKLVPGWGSIVGASGAYASTWAMARATRLYFEKGATMDPTALREVFKDAKKEGAKKAKEASFEIEAEAARIAATKDKLDAELAAGTITEEQYAEQIARS